MNERDPVASPWLEVKDAAAYIHVSLRKLSELPIQAHGEGAKKVYHRDVLDAWEFAHPWQGSTALAPAGTSIGANTANVSGALLERLAGKRLRPYKPRKKLNSQAS